MDILKAENICKTYGTHKALDNVSISIPEGTIVGLMGPNGAGKTTLIRIINQIITPDSGKIFFRGNPISYLDVQQIGYLPEERGLYKKMKVEEQLLYFAQLKGLPKKEAVPYIKEWIEKFQMEKWANKKIEDLSKGMAQKIQFITTVLHKPKLLILDEPFSGFDPVNALLIRDEILQLKENGSTIIFSSHRMESIEELCDDVVLIHKAKKILDGKKKEIKEKFKNNSFMIEYTGTITHLQVHFQIISTEIKEEITVAHIKILNELSANALLQELISQVQIKSFVEKVPSMNDIFIQMVQS
ncbi:MAG: ATP-binding cassette domain-containing protein [Chitinophagaceae bacterium]|nr:ATP-binding cassette domain-containing protein [Chitinophagaceae bacterium]